MNLWLFLGRLSSARSVDLLEMLSFLAHKNIVIVCVIRTKQQQKVPISYCYR